MTTVLIDNYDSFTYNLYQYLAELGADVKVFRNDQVTLDEIRDLHPDHVVISPGPGDPDDAGISRDVIREFAGKVPVLGVCLGHQCIFDVYGGTVAGAGEIKHGKTSKIHHDGKGVFKDIGREKVTSKAADRGKFATYFARWTNARGEMGPWSNPVSACIAA